jgi:hydroxypyruvate reductase
LGLAVDDARRLHASAATPKGGAEVAGAVIGPDTLARARAMGLDPQAPFDDNNSYTCFGCLVDRIVTGPTLTSFNDVRAILVTKD